jgi:hypothetical protein
MKKSAILLVTWLVLSPPLHPGQAHRDACVEACTLERPNEELQREEVIALEKETVHAIRLGDATFFRRVYSDDFSGVLSHGMTVNKDSLIAAVQAPYIKYDSVGISDIKVRVYRDIAVATCSWSMRAVLRGQRVSSQMLVMHVYIYSAGGYHVIAAQTTLLPPFIDQPL